MTHLTPEMLVNISLLQDTKAIFNYMIKFHGETTMILLGQYFDGVPMHTRVMTDRDRQNVELASVLAALDATNVVHSIKKIREITGASLKNSKDFIDYYRSHQQFRYVSSTDNKETILLELIEQNHFRNEL